MTNINDHLQRENKYSLGSKFKEKLSQLFYYHGLNCSRHPYLLVIFSIFLFCFCCYPIFGIHLFQNDFAQEYVTDYDTFRDLRTLSGAKNLKNDPSSSSSPSDAQHESNNHNNLNIDLNSTDDQRRLKNAPRWFNNAKSQAYVMQIIVQSAVIPWQQDLILMDAIRGPIAQVFSIVESISNHRLETQDHSIITLNDVCLQVAEPIMLKDESAFSYLPRYSCLTLSPANVWRNDLNKFLKDSEIIKTIFDIKDTSSLETGSLKELLFGLSWMQTGIRRLYVRTRQRTINYAITLVFKEFDEQFIQSLKKALKQKFPSEPFKSQVNQNATAFSSSASASSHTTSRFLNKNTVHLYFKNQKSNFSEFMPLSFAFFVVFLIIYFSVCKIDLIRNKFILACGSVLTIVFALLSSIGICFWLESNPTLNGSDILPYLVMLVSFENVFVLIKSVASTPYHLDMKVRMALGLSKEALSILNNFLALFTLFLLGFLTFIPLIQDIALFGLVALTSDLILQLMFFSPLLAKQLRKTSKNSHQSTKGHKKNLSASKPITWTMRNSNSETNLQKTLDSQSPTKIYARPSTVSEPVREAKRLRFFYFITNYRIVHKLMVIVFIAWIIMLSIGDLRFIDIKIKLNQFSAFESGQHFSSRSLNDMGYKDKMSLERNESEKNEFANHEFLFPHFLSSQHWSTLFWAYNISLSGKYITILPALQLSIPVKPEGAIETRHFLESDPQIFRQYLFPNLKKIPLKDSDSIDDYEDEILHKNLEINKWSKKSIITTSLILIVICFLIIYLLTSLYRCLCTRSYPEWRNSWFKNDKSINTMNYKNLEDLVMETLPIKFRAHEQEIEYLCTDISSQTVISCDLQGDVKVWSILSGECETFIRRSNFEDIVKSKSVNGVIPSNGSSSVAESALNSLVGNGVDDNGLVCAPNLLEDPNLFENSSINRPLINGPQHANHSNNNRKQIENDGYDFSQFYHKANFSSNFISKFIFNASRTSSVDKIHNNDDISSQANVTVKSELKFQSIWSVHQKDKLVFIGCSNGRFEVWHINSGELCYYNETSNSGITVISSNNNKLVIARLTGFIEIYEQELKSNNSIDYKAYYRSSSANDAMSMRNDQSTTKSQNYITFRYLQTINAHKQPITCLKLDHKYMVTGSADNLIRVFKFDQLICNSLFTLHGHFAAITCLEIDMNSNSAVSGCDSGQVCVWELSTGACIFSLEAHNGTITEILVTSLYIVSSAVDNKIIVWDRYSGNLVNTINCQYSLCHKMIIMASNILVTVHDDELHFFDIEDSKKIKVVKISGDERFALIRNLGLSFKSRVIVCDYGAHLCFIHFPGIMQKLD